VFRVVDGVQPTYWTLVTYAARTGGATPSAASDEDQVILGLEPVRM
jgi:hypothetical protein